MKKAQNALQVIFGLFLLLIITLVLLGIFFRTTEKSQSGLEGSSAEFFSKQQVNAAIGDCQNYCNGISNVDTALEFCKRYQKIDFNGNQLLNEPADYGRYTYCEDFVPCAAIVDCSDKGYGLAQCKALFTSQGRTDLELTKQAADNNLNTCTRAAAKWEDEYK